MSFVTFDLERWQGTWENRVRYNLSESGVHPLSIAELLDLAGEDPTEFLALRMAYSQSDGTLQLRKAISALYPGATADNVVVTVGSSEGNFITCWTLIERGDRVTVLTPTYRQTWGLAQNFGATVTELPLLPNRAWEPDPEAIESAIPEGTKLVVVTSPNNPSGHVLSDTSRDAILRRARSVEAWVLADEVYQGAERNGVTTPSVWGSHERLIVVNGLSKAYGLPGLRIGWIVGPRELRDAIVRRHDYTVIGPSPASDYLALRALSVRDQILARTRRILNENYSVLDGWLRSFGELFQWHEPECGAICLARYRHPMPAIELAERVLTSHDILALCSTRVWQRANRASRGSRGGEERHRSAVDGLAATGRSNVRPCSPKGEGLPTPARFADSHSANR